MEKFHEIMLDSAHVNIGKNGITPGMIQHITNLLKKNPMLKVKVLQEIAHENGIDPFIETLIRELHVYIYDARGFTFIISKRRYPELHEPKNYHKLRKDILALQEEKEWKSPQDSKIAEIISTDEDFIDYENEEVQKQLQALDETQEAKTPDTSRIKEIAEEKPPILKSTEWRIPIKKVKPIVKPSKISPPSPINAPPPPSSPKRDQTLTTSADLRTKVPPSPKLPPNSKNENIIPSILINPPIEESLDLAQNPPVSESKNQEIKPKKKSTKKSSKKTSKKSSKKSSSKKSIIE